MKKRTFIIIGSLVIILISLLRVDAQMSSTNYRITTTVMSGGGSYVSSANFQTSGTVSQPSPLMDPFEPPLSDTYDLYPGFWYAMMGPKCESDYDGDGDVDGGDLVEYLFDPGGFGLNVFATDFGRANCP